MGAGLGNAAPFLLGAAGSGASGLITGQRQADEHAQLMQMLAMQQAREGREQGLYPSQVEHQQVQNQLDQSQLDYQKAAEPFKLQAEKYNAMGVSRPYQPESPDMLAALHKIAPSAGLGDVNFDGMNEDDVNKLFDLGFKAKEQSIQSEHYKAMMTHMLSDKGTRDLISLHNRNQENLEKALYEQNDYESKLLPAGSGATKDPALIAADRLRLKTEVDSARAAAATSQQAVNDAMDRFMNPMMYGQSAMMQGGAQLPMPAPSSVPPPFTPKKYTVSQDQ